MYIDTHAHLTLLPEEELASVIARAKEQQIEAIVNVCTTLEELHRALPLSEKYPWIHNAAATTPHDVATLGEKEFDEIKKAAENRLLVAIGETGLDYGRELSPREMQRAFFIRYLHLARHLHLPIIIHCRDAFDDLFDILDDEYGKLPLVLHCFTGSAKDVEKALDRGFYISLSGIITFKSGHALREVVKEIPLSHLLLETDTPYLTPQSKRGKQNEPSYIVETAEMISLLKQIPLSDIAKATTANARRLFGIKFTF